jgi:hypothetical protein
MIVDSGGLVHRFPEISAGLDEPQPGDDYLGSFVVPSQFERRLASPTALRAGGVTVAVPGAVLTGEAAGEPGTSAAVDVAPDTADPVIAALREELRQRIAEETGLRRELGQLRTQLEARARNANRLEQTHGELRDAVGELTARLQDDEGQRVALETSNTALEAANASLSAEVAGLRAALERAEDETARVAAERDAAVSELSDRYAELAAAKVSQETALEEVDELRRELERGEAALAEAERSGSSELEEAESLLAQTRALTARLISRGGESHRSTDDAGD